MSRFTVGLGRPTFADRIFPRALASDAILVATGVGLVSICAQILVPLSLLPITAQSMAALFVGMLLGSLRGAVVIALYLLIGWAGLPVFSDGGSGPERLFGPSGGYLFGFLLAAAAVGWVAERGWDRTFPRAALSALAGTAIVYLVGLPWYGAAHGAGFGAALSENVMIFLVSDVIKAMLTAAAVSACWAWARRSEQEEIARNPSSL